MLRSHHRYELQSVYFVGSLVNDWCNVSLWVGIGGLFGGRDNRLCCLWYSVGLGVRGLWVGVFDVFWVLFRVVVLGVGFLALDFHCAWLGAFGVSTGEKKYFNKCERM